MFEYQFIDGFSSVVTTTKFPTKCEFISLNYFSAMSILCLFFIPKCLWLCVLQSMFVVHKIDLLLLLVVVLTSLWDVYWRNKIGFLFCTATFSNFFHHLLSFVCCIISNVIVGLFIAQNQPFKLTISFAFNFLWVFDCLLPIQWYAMWMCSTFFISFFFFCLFPILTPFRWYFWS